MAGKKLQGGEKNEYKGEVEAVRVRLEQAKKGMAVLVRKIRVFAN